MDDLINQYYQKLNNKECYISDDSIIKSNDNKLRLRNNNKLHDTLQNHEIIDSTSQEVTLKKKPINKINTSNKFDLRKNNKKHQTDILETLDLNANEINEIFEKQHNIPIIRNILNIKIKYIYKHQSKNYIYYNCKLEQKCGGKAKIDLEKKINNHILL